MMRSVDRLENINPIYPLYNLAITSKEGALSPWSLTLNPKALWLGSTLRGQASGVEGQEFTALGPEFGFRVYGFGFEG